MKRKIFYGWWVVASLIPSRLVQAGALFYIFGIFYQPFLNEFGWNRGKVSAALSIYVLTVGFFGPFIGKITDRTGAKKLIGWGAFFGGVLFLLLSRTTRLWEFYLLYFLQGVAFSACGNVPVNTALTNWFERKRGSAIGIAMAGVSIGAITITPAGGFMLQHFGWRATYVFLSVITWLLVIPPVLWVMKDHPRQMGLTRDGDSALDGPCTARKSSANEYVPDSMYAWTLREVSHSRSFWLICITYVLIYVAIGAVLGHQIAYLTDMGVSMATAATALGVTGGMGGVGKIVFGILSDRFSPKRVTIICAISQGIGILFLLFAKSMTFVWLYAVIFGFCMGGHLALQPVIVAHFFGLGSFGTIYGMVLLAGSVGSALGPSIAGVGHDLLGNYTNIFIGCVITSFLAAISTFFSRKLSIPAQ